MTSAAAVLSPVAGAPSAGRAFRLGIYAALVTLDLAALLGAFMLVGAVTLGEPLDRWVVNDLAVLAPIYFGIVLQRKPYSGRFFQNWRRATRDAVTAILTATATALLLVSYLHAEVDVSFRVLVPGVAIAAALMVAGRWALHQFAQARTGGWHVATMVVVDGPAPAALADPSLARLPAIDVTGIDIDAPTVPHAVLARFSDQIADAERVIVACAADRREAWARLLRGANVQGEVLLPEWQALTPARLSHLADVPSAVVSLGPLDTRNRLFKRIFDLTAAGSALVLSSPILLLTALAIKLDSRGPVLFRQPRVGRGNRLFHVLKFRSMYVDGADLAGDRSTRRSDPRVTRVGRIIRATSIDELPQILNVLRGEMSIVGPRPHALGSLAGDRLFWDVEPRYWQRHAIKPGITGLAQVHGYRGATDHADDLHGRVDHDLAYLRGWTLFRDLRIIVMTLRVLVHRNAF
jgi:exopolysaccharide biosynthesis polyprenyl glycosylphosphotransferase